MRNRGLTPFGGRRAGGVSPLLVEGSKALVQIKAYSDEWLPGAVTRTAWALNFKSRTLRVEIDLLNPDRGKIRPGMYAYGKVVVERSDVWAVPLAALTYSGNKAFLWMDVNGHAVRTEIQTGIDDGVWIQVLRRRPATAPADSNRWVHIDGSEQVILGDLSDLEEGEAVQVAP
jgi:multidrug efflux pump subunit AcrA (membrane-fusion protein)